MEQTGRKKPLILYSELNTNYAINSFPWISVNPLRLNATHMNTTHVSTQKNKSRSESRNKTMRMALRYNPVQCNVSAPGTTPSKSFGKTLTAFNPQGVRMKMASSSFASEAAEEIIGVKGKLKKREAELNRLRGELMKLRKEVARLRIENEKYKDLFRFIDTHKLDVLIEDKEAAKDAFITEDTISLSQPVGEGKKVYTTSQTPKNELTIERTSNKTIGTVYHKG
eukprot:TRINITY_DN3901_c0_g1_i3.p1 TRINITY_DN3901_c0_g1~~TRINITY_DN3901_c0_g1_i3.p1  ORF type:complete len:225 (-),score=24.71 TRINITY_DN3901_c0_g1_i3:391-1065(-)